LSKRYEFTDRNTSAGAAPDNEDEANPLNAKTHCPCHSWPNALSFWGHNEFRICKLHTGNLGRVFPFADVKPWFKTAKWLAIGAVAALQAVVYLA
jgi:hypothetical protein